jgi:hypothetical protein
MNIREIKIRNITRSLNKIISGETTPLEWCDEDREWYPGEKEQLIEEIEKVLEALKNE